MNITLKLLYDRLNQKYWNNTLPEVIVKQKKINRIYGEYHCPNQESEDKPENYIIYINVYLLNKDKVSIKKTMLHEMCHHFVFINNKQKYWKKQIKWHGVEWRKEMQRVGFEPPIRKTT